MKNLPEETITVRLPSGLKDKLKSIAKKSDLTLSQVIRRALFPSAPTRKTGAERRAAA